MVSGVFYYNDVCELMVCFQILEKIPFLAVYWWCLQLYCYCPKAHLLTDSQIVKWSSPSFELFHVIKKLNNKEHENINVYKSIWNLNKISPVNFLSCKLRYNFPSTKQGYLSSLKHIKKDACQPEVNFFLSQSFDT